MAIFTNEVEQQVLGGLLNYPEYFPEVASALSPDIFQHEINQTIFAVLRTHLSRGDSMDRTLLVNRMKNGGLSFADNGIEIGDYVDVISRFKPPFKDFNQSLKQCIKLSAKRFLIESIDKTKKSLSASSSADMSVVEMQRLVEKNLTENFDKIQGDDEVIDIMENMYDDLEERGNNQKEDMGFKIPHAKLAERAAIAKPGEITVIAARPGAAKSTFLMDLSYNVCQLNDCIGLYIDTELNATDSRLRLASMLSGVPFFYLETGQWRNVPEYCAIIRSPQFKVKMKNSMLYFKFLPDASADEVSAIAKKVYYSKVGRGGEKKMFLTFDYFKITAGEGAKAEKEYQAFGHKVQAIKDLVTKHIDAPAFAAIQQNRVTDKTGHIADDETSIGGSDRVMQYVSSLYILRRRRSEEVSDEGKQYGTHRLISLKERHQGKFAKGHDMLIKSHDGRLVNDFVNFDIKNFKVTENSTAEEMYADLARNSAPQKKQAKKQDDKESF